MLDYDSLKVKRDPEGGRRGEEGCAGRCHQNAIIQRPNGRCPPAAWPPGFMPAHRAGAAAAVAALQPGGGRPSASSTRSAPRTRVWERGGRGLPPNWRGARGFFQTPPRHTRRVANSERLPTPVPSGVGEESVCSGEKGVEAQKSAKACGGVCRCEGSAWGCKGGEILTRCVTTCRGFRLHARPPALSAAKAAVRGGTGACVSLFPPPLAGIYPPDRPPLGPWAHPSSTCTVLYVHEIGQREFNPIIGRPAREPRPRSLHQ